MPAEYGVPADQMGLAWRKGKAGDPNGACVEVAPLPDGGIAVRNSRHPSGSALIYSRRDRAIPRGREGQRVRRAGLIPDREQGAARPGTESAGNFRVRNIREWRAAQLPVALRSSQVHGPQASER